jgi:hypothetical protein
VRGLAPERDLVALDAVRPKDDSEREVHRLENRALLDVQLEVGGGVLELAAGVGRLVEVDAVSADCIGERHAVGVPALPQLFLVGHRARGRARAEQRAPEARALLVGPADEPHRDRRRAFLRDPPQHLRAGDHIERAVEPAPVRDRVEVPTDDQRPFRLPGHGPPLVPRLVELHLDPVELAGHPVLGPHPRVRPGHTLSAVLCSGQLLQLVELGDGPLRIEHAASFSPWLSRRKA